jgi:hypothetical protein
VPDLEGDVELINVKVAQIETFLAAQQLPRLRDVTPEMSEADVTIDDAAVRPMTRTQNLKLQNLLLQNHEQNTFGPTLCTFDLKASYVHR